MLTRGALGKNAATTPVQADVRSDYTRSTCTSIHNHRGRGLITTGFNSEYFGHGQLFIHVHREVTELVADTSFRTQAGIPPCVRATVRGGLFAALRVTDLMFERTCR